LDSTHRSTSLTIFAKGILAKTNVAAANSFEAFAQSAHLDCRADLLCQSKPPLEARGGRIEMPTLLVDAADQPQAFDLAPLVPRRGEEA
jgi:hypothetical protein